jgi:hypothetical protein
LWPFLQPRPVWGSLNTREHERGQGRMQVVRNFAICCVTMKSWGSKMILYFCTIIRA